MTVTTSAPASNPPPPPPRRSSTLKILKAFMAILLIGGVTTFATLMLADNTTKPAPPSRAGGPPDATTQPTTASESAEMAADLEKALHAGDDIAAERLLDRLLEADKRLVAVDRMHLLTAVRLNRVQMVDYMLAHGIDTSAVDPTGGAGNKAVHLAATLDDPRMITMLVETGRLDVNDSNTAGRTPLHLAAEAGKTKVVAKLAGPLKADVNAKDSGGNTPLHLAAKEGQHDVVQALLKAGADATIKNGKDQTAADLAADTGVKSLLR